MNRTNSLNGIVEKHANMRAYLQHRQRVLDMKPRVDNKRPRSKSIARISNAKETATARKIHEENLRLLGSLIKISKRQSDLGSYSSSAYSRSKSCSRSSVSSINSTPIARKTGR